MKKLALTIAIVLTMGLSASAQFSSMLGKSDGEIVINRDPAGTTPLIVQEHGLATDEGADGAPLGSGVAVLLGLGATYFVAKKRKVE